MLIGLGILATHSVTLDYPNARMLLHPRAQTQSMLPHPGFALMLNNGMVRVVQIFVDSAAQQAELKRGNYAVSIDGQGLASKIAPCKTTRWLIETRPTQSAKKLTVLREGQRLEIDLGDR